MSIHYHDDPVKKPAARRPLPKFIAAGLLVFYIFFIYQTTFALNFRLNSNRTLEFAQSVTATAPCTGANEITVTPRSTFVNANDGGGTYYLSSVKIAGIPNACDGKDLSLSFYDSATGSSALPIYSFNGENKRVATVWNGVGYSLPGFQSSGIEVSSASGEFTVTFKTPVALATNVKKVIIQSTEHKDWAETSISSLHEHNCVVLATTGVKCWGYGLTGEMGTGLTENRRVQISPTGLSSGVSQISAGYGYTCAVLSKGTAKCWGANTKGQLGNNSRTNALSPVDVLNLSGIRAITTGYEHTCALLSTGAVRCWGRDIEGNVGNNSTVGQSGDINERHYLTPQAVYGLSSGVTQISAGQYHTCALLNTGGVKCWGYNVRGPLGNGNNTSYDYPVDVSGLSSGVIQISAGEEHTCAVLSNGGVRCWGLNTNGRLGNNSTSETNVPVNVSNISNAILVAAGGKHTCAVLSTGAVQCWGFGGNGNLGNNSVKSDNTIPVTVLDWSGVKAIGIETGMNHSCALLSTGAVKCWGYGQQGQLGHNVFTNVIRPVDVLQIP